MLQPARTKYRKQQKGRNTGIATRGNKVSFGEYGLKAIGSRPPDRAPARGRRAVNLSRHIKRGGRVWIRVFPDKPVSRKPAEVRMGNGKGNPEYFVCRDPAGQDHFRDGRGGCGACERKPSRWPRPSCRSAPRPCTDCWDRRRPLIKEERTSGRKRRRGPDQGAARTAEGAVRPAHAARDAAVWPTTARSGSCDATSRACAPSMKEKAVKSTGRSESARNHGKEPAQAGRPRGERQDAEDRGGQGRAPGQATREMGKIITRSKQIPRAFRATGEFKQGRPGRDRRVPADLENQVLDGNQAW